MNAQDKKSITVRVIATAAAAVLLCAAALVLRGYEQRTAAAAEDTSWEKTIAYVPLDDRTDNTDYVEYQAAACGYHLVEPDRSLFSTKLDGQARNPNGTQYGDREALLQWVRDMDSQGCDIFLLSLDQLMSGGLVNSRAVCESAPLDMDGKVMTETQAFDEFIAALAADPDNRVYLFDSVMRLASTVSYNGLGIDEYEALRRYGSVARPVLADSELTVENIAAAYPFASDGVTPAESVSGGPTGGILKEYLAARERKLRLLDHEMRAVRPLKGRFLLLVGVDDSSGGNNIQSNELRYISLNLSGGVLMPGMDSMARLLLARIALDEDGRSFGVNVEFFGGGEDEPSSDYDHSSLRRSVASHLALYGAAEASAKNAQINMIVLTAPEDPSRSEEYCRSLINELVKYQSQGAPLIFIDASHGKYGGSLTKLLLSSVDFDRLLGYSGIYDQASVTGAAAAMGFSRYIYLRGGQNSAACDAAHVRQLANSMILSMVYCLGTRYTIDGYISSLGLDYDNIVTSPEVMGSINSQLYASLSADCGAVLQNLMQGYVISGNGGLYRGVENVGIESVVFPWNRSFEISMKINVVLRQGG